MRKITLLKSAKIISDSDLKIELNSLITLIKDQLNDESEFWTSSNKK